MLIVLVTNICCNTGVMIPWQPLDELPKDNFNQAHIVLMNSSKQCDDLIGLFNEK